MQILCKYSTGTTCPLILNYKTFHFQFIELSVIQQRGFPGSKESVCSAGDAGLIPGQGRCPGEGNGNLPQYFRLGNPMDKGAWRTTARGVAKESDTTEQLSTHTHSSNKSHNDLI